MHRPGIVSDVEPCATQQFGKLRNGQPGDDHRSVDLRGHGIGKRFLTGTRSHHDRKAARRKPAADFGKALRRPPLGLHDRCRMNDHIPPAFQRAMNSGSFRAMPFKSHAGRLFAPHAQPSKHRHCRFHCMRRKQRRRYAAVIELRTPIMFCADAWAPDQPGVQEACRPAVQVDDSVKAAREQSGCGRPLAAGKEDFIEIGVSIETIGEPTFHENRHAEFGELLLEGAYRCRQQQAVPHRAETYEKDSGTGRKPVKKIFSLQFSLR